MGCHFLLQCMKVKSESEVAQSYLTLSDPMDCSLPGSSAHGTSQARVLEWVAIAFSKVGLTQSHFKLLLLLQVLVCVRFCTSFLRVEGPHYISTVWMVGGPWGICFSVPWAMSFCLTVDERMKIYERLLLKTSSVIEEVQKSMEEN